ncbi:MAG: FAD-dependent oxidoreductase [Planctomycetaceae bacterium]|nr:FAD-dependent oxidoreductase [Planctomycetaceae bacterium]
MFNTPHFRTFFVRWFFVLSGVVCVLCLAPGVMAAEDSSGSEGDDSKERSRQPRVVIVGAGISGLSAALELGQTGVAVTVVDMSSVFGGHAVMSQGGVTIVDTPLQDESGLSDSPDLAYSDFMTWGEDANAGWVRQYVDTSRQELYDWLTNLGVRFKKIDTAPGNTVDRFHQPVGRGIGLVTPIYRACLKHDNIQFVWNMQATKLLSEEERVVGIEASELRKDETVQISADHVILATGGFQSNLDMVREFWPQEMTFPERILAGSGRNSVGHGHRLAQAAGGQLVEMDRQWNYFTGIPDPRHPDGDHGLSAANMYGIIVNPEGRRFANLHNWAKAVMPAMLQQKRVTIWWIFDEASKPEFVVSGSDWSDFKKVERLILDNPALVKKADTIEELARLAGLPPENLIETIERYNHLVDSGRDDDFGRFGPDRTEYNNTASPKINTPPYYAMQSWPLTRKSMGGVAVDRECRVTDRKGTPIPGLYAVGELTGLVGINGKAALEGTFLGPCILTGRVAARSILAHSEIPFNIDTPQTVPSSTERCADCHDIESMIETPREGYWHFEQAHRRVLQQELNCLQCHAELAPYDEDHHRIDRLALTSTCTGCHAGEE